MFFIGIFSSIIPYIVIAGIYLVGIGMYSLEKRQVECIHTDAQEHLTVENNMNNGNEKDVFSYFDSNYDLATVNPDKTIKPFVETNQKLLWLLNPPPSTGTLNIIYFCRPPPFDFIS